MNRWWGRVALVTGASVGIGVEIARNLVREGMRVVICARNQEKLKQLEDELNKVSIGSTLAIRCDLSKEEEITVMFEGITEKMGGIDVLVNNAGMASDSPLATGKTGDWRYMTEVNILGPATCTREALSSMKARGVDDGHIININSLSGQRVLPQASLHFYAATKFALSAMTDGLRYELRDMQSRIKVSQICPGLVQSEFRQRALPGEEPVKDPFKSLEARDIADSVISILATPPHVQIHDVHIRPIDQYL